MLHSDQPYFSDYFSPEAKKFRAEFISLIRESNFYLRELKLARLEKRITRSRYKYNKLGNELKLYSVQTTIGKVSEKAIAGWFTMELFLN